MRQCLVGRMLRRVRSARTCNAAPSATRTPSTRACSHLPSLHPPVQVQSFILWSSSGTWIKVHQSLTASSQARTGNTRRDKGARGYNIVCILHEWCVWCATTTSKWHQYSGWLECTSPRRLQNQYSVHMHQSLDRLTAPYSHAQMRSTTHRALFCIV